jgi:hypothetical protein
VDANPPIARQRLSAGNPGTHWAHHPKSAVGALFAEAFARACFWPSAAAPAKLQRPQPQRERCSLKTRAACAGSKRFTPNFCDKSQANPAHKATLYAAKPSRRAADDKNVTF